MKEGAKSTQETLRHRLFHDERGMSMIMVVGMAGIFAVILAVITSTSINGLRQVRREREFEQSLHVADSGVDHTLFKLAQNRSHNTGEALPASPFSNVAAEEAWARGIADSAPTSRLVETNEGEWVVIKPTLSGGGTSNLIYSVGYVPSRASANRIRVIRSEYDFAGFSPTTAILTDGSLEISGNLTVTGSHGSAHANGNITGSGSGASFSGHLSAVGSYTPGGVAVGNPSESGGGKPPKEVPNLNPREYFQFAEYELCPNGSVMAGPKFNGAGANTTSPAVPSCAGAGGNGGALGANNYRGWTFAGSTTVSGVQIGDWRYNDNTAYDGVYYLYRGNANLTGNAGEDNAPWRTTIIAEAYSTGAENHSNCSSPGHLAGDITLSGGPDIQYSDKAAPVTLLAGRDLEWNGNAQASSVGAFLVHEQFRILGAATIDGSIIANDSCNTIGSPVSLSASLLTGSGSINYSGGLELPVSLVPRITNWLEL